jgi:hypothetical protein
MGPAKMHYRNYKFFIPETHGYRIASTAKFFPAHCKMPAIEPGDTVRLAAQDLIKALNTNSKAPLNLEPKHTEALRLLADIFQEAIPKEGNAVNTPPPRVYTPSTSNDATAPRVVAKQPRIHQRVTRRNKPIIEPVIKDEEEEILFEEVVQEKAIIQPVVPPTRPRRSIAKYREERLAATKTNETLKPVPTITQDNNEANSVHFAPCPRLYTTKNPCTIPSHALYHLMGQSLEQPTTAAYIPRAFHDAREPLQETQQFEHCANPVVHPVTKETITKYEKLANDPLLRDVWTAAMSKELGRLAQGFNDTEGTETIFLMSKDEIKEIPKDRTVTYARIVVDYRPQKADPNRVRITVRGNLIDYPGELTTRTADITCRCWKFLSGHPNGTL